MLVQLDIALDIAEKEMALENKMHVGSNPKRLTH